MKPQALALNAGVFVCLHLSPQASLPKKTISEKIVCLSYSNSHGKGSKKYAKKNMLENTLRIDFCNPL
jgi:hypothetical protein